VFRRRFARQVIYVDAGRVRADYFDSEGHVIRYVVEARSGEVVFLQGQVTGRRRVHGCQTSVSERFYVESFDAT
jgi:hypothetical protein